MNKILLARGLSALLLCSTLHSNATDVYITIDEDGNRIFSDTPSKKSRTHKIKEISIIPAITLPKTTATGIDVIDTASGYKNLTITSPLTESTLTRNMQGNFVVSAQLSPELSAGDEAVLFFDGKEISAGKQLSWQINSANRGAHDLQVIIRQQKSQQQRISSQAITVYVKR